MADEADTTADTKKADKAAPAPVQDDAWRAGVEERWMVALGAASSHLAHSDPAKSAELLARLHDHVGGKTSRPTDEDMEAELQAGFVPVATDEAA